MKGTLVGTLALSLGMAFSPLGVSAQELADFDYEHLSFRGFSLEGGYIWPNKVDPTYTMGIRLDMGYLGPGLRIVPGISYWSSTMKAEEVQELAARIGDLADPNSSGSPVDLGSIDQTDLVLSLDSHFVWSIPFGMLSYLGGGVSAHIMNGDGVAINGTFVEDLLDTVKPGINGHIGLELPLTSWFRLYGTGRYELMEDLHYPEVRMGGQIMVGRSMPEEGGSR
jgi:hypothetical protein